MPPEVHDAVLSRDHYQCQASMRDFALDLPCSGRLVVHHRVLRSQGGADDDLDLLMTICDGHHRYAHDVDRAAAELTGVIIRGG